MGGDIHRGRDLRRTDPAGTYARPGTAQEALRRTTQELAEAEEQRRHWHGMVAVFPNDDGSLRVRCYALVFATRREQQPVLHRVCVCEDVLVRENGGLLVKSRKVTRDDLP